MLSKHELQVFMGLNLGTSDGVKGKKQFCFVFTRIAEYTEGAAGGILPS